MKLPTGLPCSVNSGIADYAADDGAMKSISGQMRQIAHFMLPASRCSFLAIRWHEALRRIVHRRSTAQRHLTIRPATPVLQVLSTTGRRQSPASGASLCRWIIPKIKTDIVEPREKCDSWTGKLLQHWYALSAPSMEEALYDTAVMRRFAGIKTWSAFQTRPRFSISAGCWRPMGGARRCSRAPSLPLLAEGLSGVW